MTISTRQVQSHTLIGVLSEYVLLITAQTANDNEFVWPYPAHGFKLGCPLRRTTERGRCHEAGDRTLVICRLRPGSAWLWQRCGRTRWLLETGSLPELGADLVPGWELGWSLSIRF